MLLWFLIWIEIHAKSTTCKWDERVPNKCEPFFSVTTSNREAASEELRASAPYVRILTWEDTSEIEGTLISALCCYWLHHCSLERHVPSDSADLFDVARTSTWRFAELIDGPAWTIQYLTFCRWDKTRKCTVLIPTRSFLWLDWRIRTNWPNRENFWVWGRKDVMVKIPSSDNNAWGSPVKKLWTIGTPFGGWYVLPRVSQRGKGRRMVPGHSMMLLSDP